MSTQYNLVVPLMGVAAAEALRPAKKMVRHCFDGGKNVGGLQDATVDLNSSIQTLQGNIETGLALGRVVTTETERWMARASELASEADAIMARYSGRSVLMYDWSLAFWSIYSISKEAMLKQKDIRQHQNSRPSNDELFVQIADNEAPLEELHYLDFILGRF